MDYRQFLQQIGETKLPYFGGRHVYGMDRHYRVRGQVAPGWYSWKISGRYATAIGPCEPREIDQLPRKRGHYARGYAFGLRGDLLRVHRFGGSEPEVLAPCSLRLWPSGDYLFETTDFETEVEEEARARLHRRAGLAEVSGATPALRAAFAYCLVSLVASAANEPFSPWELGREAGTVADGGIEAATQLLQTVLARRREQQRIVEQRRSAAERGMMSRRRSSERAEDSAARVLDDAGAVFRSLRSLDDQMIEVTFEFMGEEFTSVVHEDTHQVFDAGICLSGADREVTLASLPSVIREAITTGQLYITR